MRKWLALLSTFALLFALASCSLPFGDTDPVDTGNSSNEHTFVITTQGLTGLFRMADGITWRQNTMCSLQYVGTRDNYEGALHTLYQKRFSSVVDSDSFDALRKVEAGGDDVILVVPRFDLENISVFGVQKDSEGKTHVLKQYADLEEPFLLFCNANEDTPSVQMSISLRGAKGYYKIVPQKQMFSGGRFPGGFQSIENG